MTLILSIETSTKVCSVALSDGESIVAFREHHEARFTHAEKLNVFVREVMEEASKGFSDLSAIAVSLGPGSYTGLRIGVSTAKGYCYAHDLPLIAVSSIRAMAAGYIFDHKPGGVIIPMTDARRMEVFCAVYDNALNELEAVDAVELDERSFEAYIKQAEVVIMGDGAGKFAEQVDHPNLKYVEVFPSAISMARLAFDKFRENDFVDVAYFEPYYLKDFVAGRPKKLV